MRFISSAGELLSGRAYLIRELPNALYEILVAVVIRSQNLAHDGDNLEAVQVVERSHEGFDLAELQDRETAIGAKNAIGFFNNLKTTIYPSQASVSDAYLVHMRAVSDSKSNRVQIERVVLKWELLGVAANPSQLRFVERRIGFRAFLANVEHVLKEADKFWISEIKNSPG